MQLADCCFFNPPLNNLRIAAQAGAFIMSPLLRKNDYKLTANDESVEKAMSTVFSKKCVIPQALKDDLLIELDWLGINRATLFTDMSSKLEYINLKQKKKFQRIDLS